MQSWKFTQLNKGKKRLTETNSVNDWGPFKGRREGGGEVEIWKCDLEKGKSFGAAERNSWEHTTQKQMTAQKGLQYEGALLRVVSCS